MSQLWQTITSKIQNWESAKKTVEIWQQQQKKVVFTNGCFDILHFGHIRYLTEARSLGDRLIVGLNSDTSVKRLKGNHRPIHELATRTHLLAALEVVDLVVLFEEDTPLQLIKTLSPDVLVKGGDWSVEQIVGSDWVIKNGGSVQSLQFVDGFSTTNIEQKILRNSEN
ncbi:MAG: D-glycero-beta-D-manno-heptose 1-phosphate adenylyltransferase [Bacteroidota bacterium]